MKVGTENKRQLYTAGVVGFFGLCACYFLYSELFGGPTTPPPPPPIIRDVSQPGVVTARPATTPSGASKSISAPPGFAVGAKAAPKVGVGGGALDPTLHMEAMLVTEGLVYTGTGRNIFAAGPSELEVAKPVVKAVAPARPPLVAAGPPPPPPGPPPPPPINLKFFGTATSASGDRRAFLLSGDDVYLASAGDVVQRRYRVISISASSISVEDIPNTNRQSLPLVN